MQTIGGLIVLILAVVDQRKTRCVELGGGLARKVGGDGLGLTVGLGLAEGLGLAGGLGFTGKIGGPGCGGGGQSHGGLGLAGDVDDRLGLALGGLAVSLSLFAFVFVLFRIFKFSLSSKLEISDVYESENYESNQVKLKKQLN